MFDLDFMTITYLLVLAANLALILLIGNLAMERAKEAWASVASKSRMMQTQFETLKEAAEVARSRIVDTDKKHEDAKQKLAEAEQELAALKQRQEHEALPFVYCATPTDNLDPGGTIWEFVVQHDSEGHAETDPDHHARHWLNGRLYQVQAASQAAARRQLERHLPPAEGFRITLVKREGDSLLAELAQAS